MEETQVGVTVVINGEDDTWEGEVTEVTDEVTLTESEVETFTELLLAATLDSAFETVAVVVVVTVSPLVPGVSWYLLTGGFTGAAFVPLGLLEIPDMRGATEAGLMGFTADDTPRQGPGVPCCARFCWCC